MEKVTEFLKNNNLYIILFIALLPIMIFRDFTPDNELRYLSIADEALRNGTWFMFTNHGIPYADKPPLYLWIVMLSKLLFGTYRMWFLSLFSIIPAIIIAKTLNDWTKEALSATGREAASRMLLTCGLFMGVAIFLRMDMLMCMFITLSLHVFYKLLQEKGNRVKLQWLFPVYVFLAIFSKGPMGLLIPLLVTIIYLILTRRIKSIGRYWGWRTWLVLVVCCGIWFGLAYMEGGSSYLDNMLFHQTVGRAVKSFHHEGPFYWYFKSMWYTFLPWSILLIGTFVAVILKRALHTELEKFLFTTIIVIFALCCSISSKIDIYLLPVYPFWVYFTALYIFKVSWRQWTTIGMTLPAIAFAIAFPLVLYLSRNEKFAFLQDLFFMTAAGLLSMTGLWTLFYLYSQRHKAGAVTIFTNGLFLALFIGGWGIPTMNDTLGYHKMCQEALRIAETQRVHQFASCDINRAENMDVFLHQEINKIPSEKLSQSHLKNTVLMVSSNLLPEAEHITNTKACWKTHQHAIILIK